MQSSSAGDFTRWSGSISLSAGTRFSGPPTPASISRRWRSSITPSPAIPIRLPTRPASASAVATPAVIRSTVRASSTAHSPGIARWSRTRIGGAAPVVSRAPVGASSAAPSRGIARWSRTRIGGPSTGRTSAEKPLSPKVGEAPCCWKPDWWSASQRTAQAQLREPKASRPSSSASASAARARSWRSRYSPRAGSGGAAESSGAKVGWVSDIGGCRLSKIGSRRACIGSYTARMNAPFSDSEYAARLATVHEAMAAAGLDVLYVTSPPNILYLTGYDAIWYPWRLPLGCAVVREPAQLLFFDWTRHEGYAEMHARRDELVLFEYGSAPAEVAAAFAERGLAGATVGLERYGLNPVSPILDAVEAELTAGGATIAAGDWIVDDARLYKSPAELDRSREAGPVAHTAMAGLRERIRPGMTELQVAALLTTLLADGGSEVPATPPLVCSGPTAWVDTHSFPSRRVLEEGDTISIDCCAVIDRYHANLCRTFALGEPNAEAAAMLDAAAGSLDVLRRRAVLGQGPETAMAAAEK